MLVWHYKKANNYTFASQFYQTFPTSFSITRLLHDVGVLNSDGTVLQVECPFSRYHSSGADGAYVMDASNTGNGFFFGCHHAHSQHPDGAQHFSTVEMIAECLDQGLFTREGMLDPQNLSEEALAKDLAQ